MQTSTSQNKNQRSRLTNTKKTTVQAGSKLSEQNYGRGLTDVSKMTLRKFGTHLEEKFVEKISSRNSSKMREAVSAGEGTNTEAPVES